MGKTLVTWVGNTDLKASKGEEVSLGPIAQAVSTRDFDQIILLINYPKSSIKPYTKWLSQHTTAPITSHHVNLEYPTDFGAIHESVTQLLEGLRDKVGELPDLSFHLSPGTPAMAAVWILLAKTRYGAELIESSREQGVSTVTIPFDIAAEYLPDLYRKADRRAADLTAASSPLAPEFDAILHRSAAMKRVISMAQKVAQRSCQVLIVGESGTGKELFARAIHQASPRKAEPFVAINCGAVPKDLFESEFFGYEKGAFSGASGARSGHFENANRGTIFLDEIGELPLAQQVKLLRVLQQGEVSRVGSTRARKIDIRVIAATNRQLNEDVASGRFREDLFFRLAVAVIQLPSLRAQPKTKLNDFSPL